MKLAEGMCAKITILNVASLPLPLNISSQDHIIIEQEAKKINEENSLLILEEALKIFDCFPGEGSILTRNGDAREEIIEEAEKGDYDLIVK